MNEKNNIDAAAAAALVPEIPENESYPPGADGLDEVLAPLEAS